MHCLDVTVEIGRRDRPTVDANTLLDHDQVRSREQADREPARCRIGRQLRAQRAFSIGPSNVNRRKFELWVAEALKQSLSALEAQFHPCESQVFKPFSYRHLNT